MALSARNLRWWHLHLLDGVYPEELSERELHHGLTAPEPALSVAEMRTHLAYLEEKGYVEQRTVRVPGSGEDICLIRLTAHGKDLLEHNIPEDPGIDTAGPLR